MPEVMRLLGVKDGLVHRAVWLFCACCMAGFLLESLESLISLGYIQNRQGLLYGPFTPVYGTGALAFMLFFPLLKNRPWPVIFAATTLLGTIVEYLWSWAQEALYGTLFWDYRQLPFQLNGRVNLLFGLFWGALGLLLLKWIYPPFCAFVDRLPRRGKTLVTLVLMVLLAADVTLSSWAFTRQKERQHAVAASSPVEVFLDSTYPDDWMKTQFPNMKLNTD
jgi:uncharacterized membrane protein